ncbi:hypothetical protein LTR62_003550 [Meristemomyces frigidus]|uniref:Zn(2)-C6 fungal-type domain-containing protein n=1 Tax=Meristemomyces frigidus TaxID=1508187 RepID=A0AAN7TIJ2_9PEZI|nr:hypothetical protein LTR62_003550 [Meristemomyces frigidus]
MSLEDAEDVSPSPEPGVDDQDDSEIMTTERVERASSDEEKSPNSKKGSSQPSKSTGKDPSRPRRKKARRACFACQRAHLTCGDERPCGRCIKRGLQDACHDGVRKKAKYLHDAPLEALVPGVTGNYHVHGGQVATVPGAPQVSSGMSGGLPTYYQQPTQVFPQYSQVPQQVQMTPLLPDNATTVNDYHQASIDSQPQYQATPPQQISPNPELPRTVGSDSSINMGGGSFDPSLFDVNDKSMFNFNISDMNFDNHYGALEFGMLGQMSGNISTPEVDILNPLGQSQHGSFSYGTNGDFTGDYSFGQAVPSWQTIPSVGSRNGSSNNLWTNHGNFDAFAIGEQLSVDQSPHSGGYNTSPGSQYVQPQQDDYLNQTISTSTQPQRKPSAFPINNAGQDVTTTRIRRRDTASIYSSVEAPYSYTQGFHALTAFLQKRFSKGKVLRIAKALAEIRPSFISCNQHLNRDDLIFMEKCFQRTLCEYEDFVNHYGTPTVICRRTGEIAAVSKEFSLITGWGRDVLLGKEPNLNVNTGAHTGGSGTQTGASSRGLATPRVPTNVESDPGRPQPVFLAELMDEDSVVQFYEDFAELAFGASNTSIIGASCSLLKYRTKEDAVWGGSAAAGAGLERDVVAGEDGQMVKGLQGEGGVKQDGPSLLRGDAGTRSLGTKTGMVECSMCWTVKRDVFDIPMLIVMNVSPRLDDAKSTFPGLG